MSTVNDMFQEFQTVLESAMICHIPTNINLSVIKHRRQIEESNECKNVNKDHSTRINNAGTRQVTKCFPNREKSHIGLQCTETRNAHSKGLYTFRPFVLTHRKDSGRTPRA